MGISVNADLSGIGNYLGTVSGILEAVEDPRFKGDFTDHLMNVVEQDFMVDTIAARSQPTLSHVFEWGQNAGEISSIPLFKLTRGAAGGGRSTMGYIFLPSYQPVPLPHSKFGISQDRIRRLGRHTFQLKALIMETRSSVTISPKDEDGRLFIPTMMSPSGYVMKKGSTVINPGGPQATGGFATWWNLWFGTRAQAVVEAESRRSQEWLVSTGAKYVRYAAGTRIAGKGVGGQFASGKSVSTGYIDAKAKSVKSKVIRDSKRLFDREKWEN